MSVLASPGDGEPSRALVRRARTLAAQDWSASLGETTSCALSKAGGSHPAAKFHEGKVAAFGELLRRVADDAMPDAVAEEAVRVKAQWENRRTPGSRQTREWEAYLAGGIEAMCEIVTGAEDCVP